MAERATQRSNGDEVNLARGEAEEAKLGTEDRKDGQQQMAAKDHRLATLEVQTRTRTTMDKTARRLRQEPRNCLDEERHPE